MEQPLMLPLWFLQQWTVDKPWDASSTFVNGVLEPFQREVGVVGTFHGLDEPRPVVGDEHNHRVFISVIIKVKSKTTVILDLTLNIE